MTIWHKKRGATYIKTVNAATRCYEIQGMALLGCKERLTYEAVGCSEIIYKLSELGSSSGGHTCHPQEWVNGASGS